MLKTVKSEWLKSGCAVFLILTFTGSVLPVHAGSTRFTLNAFGTGYLLLNQQSGTVSQCTKTEDGFTCDLISDDRRILEARIEALEAQLAAVQERLEKRNDIAVDTTTTGSVLATQTDTVTQIKTEATNAETSTQGHNALKVEDAENDVAATFWKELTTILSPEWRDQLAGFGSELLHRLITLADDLKNRIGHQV